MAVQSSSTLVVPTDINSQAALGPPLAEIGTQLTNAKGDINALFAASATSGNPAAVVALNTVGAGTITAASIVTKIVQRGGAQSNTNFLDTTDTALAIVAAVGTSVTGSTWRFIYENKTNAIATITNGVGVTCSGVLVVPPGTWVEFLVTISSATAVTMNGLISGPVVAQQPPARMGVASTVTSSSTTLVPIPDLTVEVSAGQKVCGLVLVFANNSTTTEGIRFDMNGGTATWTSIEFGFVGTPGGATISVNTATSIATSIICTTIQASDRAFLIAFAGVVNAAGTLIPQVAESTTAAGTVTVQINGWLDLRTTAN